MLIDRIERYGFKNKNKPTKKTQNKRTWVIVDHEVSGDGIFHTYLRKAWKWLRVMLTEITNSFHTPRLQKAWGTSGLKHREPKSQGKREKAGFIQKLRLHQQACFMFARRCGLGMMWGLGHKQEKMWFQYEKFL